MWAEGSHFIFFINGHYVGEATDDQIAAGKLAVAAGLYDANVESAFEFDNLELRAPAPPATVMPTPNTFATYQAFFKPITTAQAVQSKTAEAFFKPTITMEPIQSTATFIASTWRTILVDNFDSNKKGWETEASKDARAKTTIKIADGKYIWDIDSHDLNITWEKASQKSLATFALSVDVKQVSGPATADYGVFFRESTALYGYYFTINNDGEYNLQLYDNDWSNLINYTKSDLIRPGEVNRITVIAEGPHFTFLINGQYLTEFTDQRMKAGQVGLTTTLHDANQHAVFEFDNFELRTP